MKKKNLLKKFNLKDFTLVHHGSDSFDVEKFNKITNNKYRNKPNGGLWTSPLNSEFGWITWCKVNDFNFEEYSSKSFTLELSDDARIFIINSIDDLKKLPTFISKIGGINYITIDYEKLSKYYDAIYLTIKGEQETSWLENFDELSLYGWDCETVLILKTNKLIYE